MTLRRASAEDALFAVMTIAFTVMAGCVWWITEIVPGQDYPQFLVFVRALQDTGDPSSPFHATYAIGPWFIPTSLPVELTRLASHLFGGSLESAGKLLMTAQNVGLVASSAYLLRTLGRSRWALVLTFCLVHSCWTVVGGFVAFATALPLVVLGWALAVRWLRDRARRSGVAFAMCLCATLLWHGIAYVALGFAVAVLSCLWRAPSWRARLVSLLPVVPSLALCAIWQRAAFGHGSGRTRAAWISLAEAARSMGIFVCPTIPHATTRALCLVVVVCGAMAWRRGHPTAPAEENTGGMWRVDNPFLWLSAAYLVLYFVLPMHALGVQGVSNRFPYIAALAFVFAWNLPRESVASAVALAAGAALALWSLADVAARFRAFDTDTRGASDLMNRVGPHETLLACPPGAGRSPVFDQPNKAMIELEQYVTIRHGSLPNSSFAGYPMGFVRYVDGRNPMPGLFCRWAAGKPELTRFDYVLSRTGAGVPDPRLLLLERRGDWELYAVCGSTRWPRCDGSAAESIPTVP